MAVTRETSWAALHRGLTRGPNLSSVCVSCPAYVCPTVTCNIIMSKSAAQQSELRNCVKVEVAVLGSPSLIFLPFSCGRKATLNLNSATVNETFPRYRPVLLVQWCMLRSRRVGIDYDCSCGTIKETSPRLCRWLSVYTWLHCLTASNAALPVLPHEQ